MTHPITITAFETLSKTVTTKGAGKNKTTGIVYTPKTWIGKKVIIARVEK